MQTGFLLNENLIQHYFVVLIRNVKYFFRSTIKINFNKKDRDFY